MTTLASIVAAALAAASRHRRGGRTLALHAGWISRLVSFAVGALLGAVFIELLPHALETGTRRAVMGTVLAGLLAFFLLEKLVLWRHSHGHDRALATTRTSPSTTTRCMARARRRRALRPHDPDRQQRAQLLRRRRDRRRVPGRRAAWHRHHRRHRRARGAAAGRRFRRADPLGLHAPRAPSPSTWRQAAPRWPARSRATSRWRTCSRRCRRCSRSPPRACSTSRWPTSSRACTGGRSRSRPRGRCWRSGSASPSSRGVHVLLEH